MDRRDTSVSELLQRITAAQREADLSCARAASAVPGAATIRTAPKVLRRCYGAEPRAVELAGDLVLGVATDAGAAASESLDIRRSVSEAVARAVRHAHPDGPGQIHLTVILAGTALTVIVADDGLRPGAPAVRPGRRPPLIAQTTGGHTVTERRNGGTRVQMRWQLTTRAADGAPPGVAAGVAPQLAPSRCRGPRRGR